jgi:hypothetical protein
MKNINIVYFAWINEKKNRRNIIEGQFLDIVKSNILEYAKIFIEVTCENSILIDEVKNLFLNILIQNNQLDYEIQIHHINNFEYYGIKKLYDLAMLEPNKYYLYLHSKGIFNYGNIDTRHNNELTLTKGTVYLFKKVLDKFEENQDIMTIGLFPSNGWNKKFVWFNFFWSRGTYLITCEEPIISENRYYYENWLETGNDSLIYNLYENNFKKYDLHEAGGILDVLEGTFPLEKYNDM